jgi:nicotinamidase-related amidase
MKRDRQKPAQRSNLPGAAPVGWEKKWNQPLVWPKAAGAKPTDIKAALDAHRKYKPLLSESALILIDVDKKAFDKHIEDFTASDKRLGRAFAVRTYKTVVPNIVRLVDFFRRKKRPVVFVQWGWHRYQYPPLEPINGESVVIKKTRSAFGDSNLHAVLQRKRIKTCLFVGADTAWCVASSVRGAIDHGYRAVLVEDACVSALQEMHDATIKTLGWNQAHIMTTKQVVAFGKR